VTNRDVDRLVDLCEAARKRADAYKLAGEPLLAYTWRQTCENLNKTAIWLRDSLQAEARAARGEGA